MPPLERYGHVDHEFTIKVDAPREVETVDLVAALRASVEAAKERRKAAGR